MAWTKGREVDALQRRRGHPRRMPGLAPRVLLSSAGTQYTMGPDMEKPDACQECPSAGLVPAPAVRRQLPEPSPPS
jgi:hypothetical protein